MVRDCGVGSGADMPHEVWIVQRELLSNPFHIKPIAAFCNRRFAQFWIKNQPEDEQRKYRYFIFPALGNPEVSERIQ